MGKIRQLPLHEAQKIAAGEIIERPVNIVKELVENALDAGATKICWYLHNGGKTAIRIVDNGSGMDNDDAQNCFTRYATSKIRCFDELNKINSFGFRGEALASIAAVSRVILITKEAASDEGIKVTTEANSIKEKKPIGCTTGTDITIADLFYNIPARKKFLKKEQTEWRHIQQLFHAFCLNYPSVHFKLFSAGKPISNCPPVQDLLSRGTQLWDQTTAEHLIPIENQQKDKSLKITGIISNHHSFRYDRTALFFFVNNRWVKNYTLSSALLKGYLNVIPQGRYPTASIQISIDSQEIDINVHPRKEEILFMHPRSLEQFLQQTVKQALEKNLSTQIKKKIRYAPAQPNRVKHASTSFTPFDFDHFLDKQPFFTKSTDHSTMHKQPLSEPVAPTPTHSDTQTIQNTSTTLLQQSRVIEHNYHLIGQYKKTYLLLEKEEGLCLVDQHAAQERILYELFTKQFDKSATVNLIFPEIITVSTYEMQTIKPHFTIFHQNGIMIELFGANQLIVKSTPIHIKNISLSNLIKDVVGWVTEYRLLEPEQFCKAINKKLHAQMACKAAVKAGDLLSHEQMITLLRNLEKTPNCFSCPHGRPTSWLLSINEIEKKFRRKK